MSIGGILASALGGAAKNGVAMADKIGTENRKAERESEALQGQREYAEKQSSINYEREKDAANLLYDRQKERDKANHSFSMALASAKSSKTNSGSVKINPLVKQRVDVLTGLMKNEALKPEQYKAYSEELDQLTKVSGANSEQKVSLDSLIDGIKIPGGAKQTVGIQQQEATQNKEAQISEKINALSTLAESEGDRQALSEAVRKQENNERLSFAEQSLLLRYEEKLTNLERKKESSAGNKNLSQKAGYQTHNEGTNFFLNQALDANMR